MSFKICVSAELSLMELLERATAGGSCYVEKTPHVGNWYPNNLAIGALGIPMLVVDTTLGWRDTNFHPHTVVTDGRQEVIACAQTLTTHNRVSIASSSASEWFELGKPVADCHMAALRAAVPNIQAQTCSEFLRRHGDAVGEVLRTITAVDPSIWTRQVAGDGSVRPERLREGWSQLERDGICGLTGRDGWTIPNIAWILLDGVMAWRNYGAPAMFSLSGPDMVRYIDMHQAGLDQLYDTVRRQLSWKLPLQFAYNVVPVADMRFTVPESRGWYLDQLVKAYFHLRQHVLKRRAALQGVSENSQIKALAITLDAEKYELMENLREAAIACPEIFYDIAAANYISQYDLLANDEGIYTHPWALQAPLQEVSEVWREIVRTIKPRRQQAIAA